MKFFCFIPWFFNQIPPKFAEVKKHILSEENYDICLLKTIENHFWTTKTCFFTLLKLNFPFKIGID